MKENEIEKENENELIGENKDDENVKLISDSEKEEKNHLINILKRLETDLEKNNNESINDVYEEYLNNDDITKRNIKTNTKNCVIYFMHYFISPAFAIINLIGIYQVITIMNVLMILIKHLITDFYQEYFNDNYEPEEDLNYYNLFHKSSFTEIFESNLTMIMDFLGIIVLKSRGFRIASLIFMIINLASLLLIASFDFSKFDLENRKTSFSHILYFILCYILLFVGVGSSALLSEQILIDSEEKYNKYLLESEKKELEKEGKSDSKYMNSTQNIENEEYELKEDKNKENFISMNNLVTRNSINNSSTEIHDSKNIDKKVDKRKSIVDIKKIKEEKRREKRKEDLEQNKNYKFNSFFVVCIATILGYFGKYSINILISNIKNDYDNESKNKTNITLQIYILGGNKNSTSNTSNIHNYDQTLFYYIIGLYCGCIILSIVLYSIFVIIFTKNEKKKSKGNEYRICQICGYTIYSEDIILKKNTPKCECIKLYCKTIKNFCNQSVCSLLNFSEEDTDKDKCCCCCLEYNEKDYEKNKEFFCFCYQAKRKQNWFNKFITNESHIKLFPYMLEYFIIQLTTIGFEEQYVFNVEHDCFDESKNKTSFTKIQCEFKDRGYFLLMFILTFILFFYLTLSFSRFFKNMRTNSETTKSSIDQKLKKKNLTYKISNEILDGAHGVVFFNSIISFIFSILKEIDEEKEIYIINRTNIFILTPILMNKFFYFTLIFYCISYKNLKGFELISSSSLISIYVALWNFSVLIIKSFTGIEILYYIQIAFSSIPSLFAFIFIFIHIGKSFYHCNIIKDFLCIFSFTFLGGGLWFKYNVFEKSYCHNTCKCCRCCCFCLGKECYCDCCCCDQDICCCKCCCFEEDSCCRCLNCFYCCDCCECCESCC